MGWTRELTELAVLIKGFIGSAGAGYRWACIRRTKRRGAEYCMLRLVYPIDEKQLTKD